MDPNTKIQDLIDEMTDKAHEGILMVKPDRRNDRLIIVVIGEGCCYAMTETTLQVQEIIQEMAGPGNARVESDGNVETDFEGGDGFSSNGNPWDQLGDL